MEPPPVALPICRFGDRGRAAAAGRKGVGRYTNERLDLAAQVSGELSPAPKRLQRVDSACCGVGPLLSETVL